MNPIVLIGGYVSSPQDYRGLVAALQAPPFRYRVFVAPYHRGHWAITRDRDLRRILRIIRATVAYALEATGAERVTLLAHSMGGTLARMYLGEQPYHGDIYGGQRYVDHLITLGTPYHSRERWTEYSIGFVNAAYPGAFYAHIRYTSVVGRALRGNLRGSVAERLAYESYTTVSGSGQGTAWGDGVTTLACAALTGAEYLAVPGLFHSPFHGRPWYGEAAALPGWSRVLGPTPAHIGSAPDLVSRFL